MQFRRDILRPVYYIAIRGFLGMLIIALAPGFLLQMLVSEKFVKELMDGAVGWTLVALAVLWFASQFYEALHPSARPRYKDDFYKI